MANNEVATVDQGNVLAGLDGLSKFRKGKEVEGFESLSAEDYKVPKYKIMQPTSPEVADEKAKQGQFFNTVTGKAVDKILCNLLILGKNRVWFEKPYTKGSKPKCMSTDAIKNTDGTIVCKNCTHTEWKDNKPSDCSLSYSWLGVDEDDSPFRIICAGTSFSPTKDFINSVAPKGYEPFVYKVELSTTKEKGDNGIYYKIAYKILGIIKEEEYAKFESLQQDMKTIYETLKKQDVSTGFESNDAAADGTNNGEDGAMF